MYKGRNKGYRNRGGYQSSERGRGRGRGRGRSNNLSNELDVDIQQWSASDDYVNPAIRTPRGIGRGRPSSQPNSGTASPRGRGGRGGNIQALRGRGNWNRGPTAVQDIPLSQLLYESRPYLKPVKFVRSVYNKTLFEEVEDILQASAETEDQNNHLPTADRVTRVFSGNYPRTGDESSADEKLEEIDFADMAKIREEIDAVASSGPTPQPDDIPFEESFTGFFHNRDVSPIPSSSQANGSPDNRPPTINDAIHVDLMPTPVIAERPVDGIDRITNTRPTDVLADASTQSFVLKGEEIPSFFIDSQPSAVSSAKPVVASRTEGVAPLGLQEEPDEVIVYVAPYSRVSKTKIEGSVNEESSFPSTSVSTGTSQSLRSSPQPKTTFEKQSSQSLSFTLAAVPPVPDFDSVLFSFTDSVSTRNQPRHPPVFGVGGKAKARVKARTKEARSTRKRLERQIAAKVFGTMMSQTSQSQINTSKDRRWDERRKGDSDVDWGGDSDDNSGGADALGGEMDLDPDLEIDINAMNGFVTSMSSTGSRFVTMDDIADEERIRQEDEEDEESEGSSSDGELDYAANEEEMTTMAEPRDVRWAPDSDSVEDEEEESSVDEDASPRAGFRARLDRLREDARKRKLLESRRGFSVPETSGDDDDGFPTITAADEDEDFIASITDILDDEPEILFGRDRKLRKQLFRAIQNGDFNGDYEKDQPLTGKKKDKYIPPELREQWERDRAKKAEHKRARAQARLELAADPFSAKKGGKKGRKAMLAAARDRTVDMADVVEQIRAFVLNIGGRATMTMLPMEKADRKSVHELALAFGLKSVSNGYGEGRYTTLTKTTRTGWGVDEGKVMRILSRANRGSGGGGGKSNGKPSVPKHKDGEEVGKAAPRIGQSNIGFRILQSMGWSEGDQVGVSSGGLHVPLTAVIKNTKLGLGAS